MTVMRRYAFVPALLVVLVATLSPASAPDTPYRFWAPAGLADIIRNVVLFVPFGAALAWRGLPPRRVALWSFLLTLFVETSQLVLSGRDASLFDVASNTLGGLLGAALVAGYRWAPRAAAPWASVAAAVSGATLLLTAWLMAPSLPGDAAWYGQWTPNLGHFEWYRGHVRAATLGGVPLPGYQLRNTAQIRGLLLDSAELRVVFTAGAPTSDLAPLVSIFDGAQREIMLLAVDGRDVVFRLRPRAARVALESPLLRWPGGHAWAAGDTVDLRLRPAGPGWCLASRGLESCQPLLLRDGWMVYVAADFPPYGLHDVIAAVWLALVALPVGLLLRGRGPAIAALGLLGLAVVAAPPLGGLGVAGWFEWGALLAGLATGWLLRWMARRHYPVS